MNRLICATTLLLSMLISNVAFSQNRIVLNSGDTIKCNISKETKNYLFIQQDVKGVLTKGKIPKAEVREWSYVQPDNRTEQGDMVLSAINTEIESGVYADDSIKPGPINKMRASFTGGMGYLLGDTKPAVENLQSMGVSKQLADDYYKQLKMGMQLKASLYFYLLKDYWLGAVYNGFYSQASVTTSMQMDEVNMYYGELSEHYFVNFAGLSFYSEGRYGKQQKIGLNSSLTLGPAFYRDEAEMLNEQVLIKSTTFGMHTTLGFEYYIKPKLSLTSEAGLFLANVKKLNIETLNGTQEVALDKDNYENLSRLDFSVGLVFYW
ncbi:hypothetical protein [uncultured Draconibacterium sp.]|uniref:hypothetical protein n=1 Tax=uncultured Draconibacterium sp. TaxID=1573823 RepID=UPI0025CF8767|nr:hypothetical protein [uncultured Draconibacterium sp.]